MYSMGAASQRFCQVVRNQHLPDKKKKKNLPSSLFWGRRDKATNASHIITDGTGSHPGGQDPLEGCVIIPRDRKMVVENWRVVLCTSTCTSDKICLKIIHSF